MPISPVLFSSTYTASSLASKAQMVIRQENMAIEKFNFGAKHENFEELDPKARKFLRGDGANLEVLSDKKLKGQLSVKEKLYGQSAKAAAMAEKWLLPTEHCYLEAEGLEKTWRIKQETIIQEVDILSSRKPFDMVLQDIKTSTVELEAPFLAKKKAAVVSNELKGTSIFLVGMKCTMKTNMGKLLADVLKYFYIDSDSVVEEATTGFFAANSFQERDDENFRESETEVLKQLSAIGRLVVCAGDGAVQSLKNLALLRHGISLWIDVPLDMLANEVLRAEISSSDLMENLTTRYNELKGGYGTADATVSLLKVASQLGYETFKSVSPEDMVVQALKEIERLVRLKKMIEEAARPF